MSQQRQEHNEHWEFVRKVFHQAYLVRSFAKIQNRTRAKIDGVDASAVLTKKFEAARRRRNSFLRKILVEEAFLGISLGIDCWGSCIKHSNELICNISQFEWDTKDHQTRWPVVYSCRLCRSEVTPDRCRHAMVNVIGQVQELEVDRKEWKEYSTQMENKTQQNGITQLKVGYDDLELLSSSDIDSDESDDENAHSQNDVHQTEPKWIKFLSSRISQASSWDDRFAIKNHPIVCHYFRMLQDGVPDDVVKLDVESDGFPSSIVDLEPDLPLERQVDRLNADALSSLRCMGMLTDNEEKDVEDVANEYFNLESHGSEDVGIKNRVKNFLSVVRQHRFTQIYAISAVLDTIEYSRQHEKNMSSQTIVSDTSNRNSCGHSNSDNPARTQNQSKSKNPTSRRNSETSMKSRLDTSTKSCPGIQARRKPKTLKKRHSETSLRRRSETSTKRNSEKSTSKKSEASMIRTSEGCMKRRSEASLSRNSETSVKRSSDASEKMCGSVVSDSSGKKDNNHPENRRRKRVSSSSEQKRLDRQGSHKTTATIDTSGHEWSERTSRTMNRSKSDHSAIPGESPVKEHQVRRKLKAALSPQNSQKSIKSNEKYFDRSSGQRRSPRPSNASVRSNSIATMNKNGSENSAYSQRALSEAQIHNSKTSPESEISSFKHDGSPMVQPGKRKSRDMLVSPKDKASQSKKTQSTEIATSHDAKNDVGSVTVDPKGRKIKTQSSVDTRIETLPISDTDTESLPKKKLSSIMSFSIGKKKAHRKPLDGAVIITNNEDNRNAPGKSKPMLAEKEGGQKLKISPITTVKKEKKMKLFFQKAKRMIRLPEKVSSLFMTKAKSKNQSRHRNDIVADLESKLASKDPKSPSVYPPSTEFISSVSTTVGPSTELLNSVSTEAASPRTIKSSLIRSSLSTKLDEFNIESDPLDVTNKKNSSDLLAIAHDESLASFLEDHSPNTASDKSDKIEGIQQDVRTNEQTINDLLRQELKRRDGVINDLRRQIKDMNESVERRRGSINARKRKDKTRRDSIEAPKDPKDNKGTNIRSQEKTSLHSNKKAAVTSKRDDSQKRKSASRSNRPSQSGTTTDETTSKTPSPSNLDEGMSYELVLLDCIHKLRNIEDVESEDDDEYEFDWRSRE